MLVHSHCSTRLLRLTARLVAISAAAGALAGCSRDALDGPRWNLGGLRTTADATPHAPARGRLAENRVVVVKSGDSLAAIAQRSGVSIAQLMAANQLSDATIVPGQILILPIN